MNQMLPLEELVVYLLLWKRIDRFIGNQTYLEISDLSDDELDRRIARLGEVLHRYQARQALRDLKTTTKLVAEPAGNAKQRASRLRTRFRDKALASADRIKKRDGDWISMEVFPIWWRWHEIVNLLAVAADRPASQISARDIPAPLAAIVGSQPLAADEVRRRVWQYIRDRKLQDRQRPNVIKADRALKALFGKDEITQQELAVFMRRIT